MNIQVPAAAPALAVLAATVISMKAGDEPPFLRGELIFPSEHWHNHGSCVVETPQGDLLACWFHGSGERTADDVRVEGARRRKGDAQWSERFVLADTPGYPDTNCCMFFDPEGRLWLVYPTILANLWESALLKYRISEDFEHPGPPRWTQEGVVHVTPGSSFEETVRRWVPEANRRVANAGWDSESRQEAERYLEAMREKASDKLYRRLGWMTRAHPFVLGGRRIILPLYHDGFSCSLMAISDDNGATWRATPPLLGGGNIQPSLARRRDGTLVAFMRDNGPPPARIMESQSTDGGLNWSPVVDTSLPNPGSGAEVIALKDGTWLFVGNDTERGRNRLGVYLSVDEGRTWSRRRYLENDPAGPLAGRYHYPSILQAKDGTLHVTYSHHLSTEQPLPRDADGLPARSSIKHAQFNVGWLLAGDAVPRTVPASAP